MSLTPGLPFPPSPDHRVPHRRCAGDSGDGAAPGPGKLPDTLTPGPLIERPSCPSPPRESELDCVGTTLEAPTSRYSEKHVLGKSNEVLVVCVDVGLLDVDKKKNLRERRGHCMFRQSLISYGLIYDFTMV